MSSPPSPLLTTAPYIVETWPTQKLPTPLDVPLHANYLCIEMSHPGEYQKYCNSFTAREISLIINYAHQAHEAKPFTQKSTARCFTRCYESDQNPTEKYALLPIALDAIETQVFPHLHINKGSDHQTNSLIHSGRLNFALKSARYIKKDKLDTIRFNAQLNVRKENDKTWLELVPKPGQFISVLKYGDDLIPVSG